jgi:hypothetical protein
MFDLPRGSCPAILGSMKDILDTLFAVFLLGLLVWGLSTAIYHAVRGKQWAALVVGFVVFVALPIMVVFFRR